MNFDDIRSSYLSLSFEGGDSASIDFTRRVEGAVEKVQKQDRKDKLIMLSVTIMLVGLGIVYSILAVMTYVEHPHGRGSWGYAIYVLGITTVLPILIYKYREIGKTCYNMPVFEFVASVEKRYALLQPFQLLIIPFLVLADIAMVYMLAGSTIPTIQTILEAQIPFVISITVGLTLGVIYWHKQKLPILEELRRIKKSIE
jgi:hypothetical protein